MHPLPEDRSSPGNRDQARPTSLYTYLQRELRAGLSLIFPRGIFKETWGETVPPVTKTRLQGRQITSSHSITKLSASFKPLTGTRFPVSSSLCRLPSPLTRSLHPSQNLPGSSFGVLPWSHQPDPDFSTWRLTHSQKPPPLVSYFRLPMKKCLHRFLQEEGSRLLKTRVASFC